MFDLNACAQRLQPWIIRTPLVEIEALSERVEKKVYLKLECFQRGGSFKFRGAMNYMLMLAATEAERGVITASSGNHGLGMSLAGKLRGIKCTVVMPVTAPLMKQERAKSYGAKLILHGNSYDEAQTYASELAEEYGYAYVPSFNHEAIIEGQGTILQEILIDLPEADLVMVPVGGGGMLAGLLLAREQLQSRVGITGVEPFGAASMKGSVDAGKLTSLKVMNTVADGVAVGTPGSLNLEIVNRLHPQLCCVSDQEILLAQELLLRDAKLVVETAGATSLAGLLATELPREAERIVCVISGANVDLSYLRSFCDN